MRSEADAARYEGQIEAMVDAAREWLDEHPDHEVRVHVNAPPGRVVCTISDARKIGLVDLNEDAEAVLEAMPDADPDPRREPTLNMVVQALDAARRIER